LSTWKDVNKNSWTFSENAVVGLGGGIGEYKTSYCINLNNPRILNGKISADIKISNRYSKGAGLICRADEHWTFLAFYAAPPLKVADYTVARIGVFKQGVFSTVAYLDEPVRLDEEKNRFSLEFLAGHVRGEIQTAEKTYELNSICPHIPFPGYVGLVKFYGAGVVVSGVLIEETGLKFQNPPIQKAGTFEFDVFLCHSGADKPHVLNIAKELRNMGLTYWLDSEQIRFGDPITRKIEDGLRNSRYIVPCLSTNLSRSGWARAEYGAILNAELSGDSLRVVIPLKLDDSSDGDIPLLLRDKRRVTYTNKVEFAEFLRFLQLR
jgi:hypothetical protein